MTKSKAIPGYNGYLRNRAKHFSFPISPKRKTTIIYSC